MSARTASNRERVTGRSQPPYSLDELIAWCAAVVGGPVEGPAHGAAVAPPLPEGLRGPLVRQGFDSFDEVAIALTLAPDLDPMLGSAMSERTGVASSRYPTVSLIADMVGARDAERTAVASRLSTSGPLARFGLIEILPRLDAAMTGLPQRGPSLLDAVAGTTALLRWVFGITQLDPALFPHVRDDLTAPVTPPDTASAVVLSLRLANETPTVTTLVGPSSAHNLATALHSAALAKRPVLVVESRCLDDARFAARVAAEALLREAVMIAVGDVRSVNPHRWDVFSSVVAIGAEPALTASSRFDVLSMSLPSTGGASIGAHLVDLIRARGLEITHQEAVRISRWEHLRHEDLEHVAAVLAARSPRSASGRPPHSVTAQDVAAVVVGAAGDELAHLATPVETSREWSQLVLADDLRHELRELVDQAQSRSAVMHIAGMATHGLPRGISALFAGPSGTGKRFAARLAAGELGLPLYAVNLAATVSQDAVAATRTLDAVFTAAERSDAVLLFDGADALLAGIRDVPSPGTAPGRLEVSALFDRMAGYDGVSILATEALGALDESLAARLSFCLRFPYPDEAQRLLIWKAVWPSDARFADDVDLADLAARHLFSGGRIRRVAVAATYLAQQRGGTIDRAVLNRAIARDYAKLSASDDALRTMPGDTLQALGQEAPALRQAVPR
jgi:hypothetical protein